MCNYVQNRNGTYYFRRVVPLELRPLFGGRREWTYSLKTKDKKEAERKARLDAVALDQEIEQAQQRLTAQATAPAKPEASRPMSDQEMWEIEAGELAARDNALWEHEYEEREADRQKILDAFAKGSELTEFNPLALRDILRDQRWEVEVAKEQAMIARYYQREAERQVSDVRPSSEAVPPTPVARDASGPTLDDVIKKWARERQAAPKTVDAHKAVVRAFHAQVGRVPVQAIARKDVIAFKDGLLEGGVSPANAITKLSRLRTLLSYAEANDYLSSNPAKGLVIIDPDAERRKRLPFGREALSAIFGSPVFAQDERPKDGRGEAAYWLPLMALYTGARLEELGQLRPEDVRSEVYLDDQDQEHQAWTIHIVEDQEQGLKLKNAGSERVVPVHPVLKAAGFVAFAEAAQREGRARLFPELKPDKYGRLTAKWGEWFSRYKREVCGVTDPRLVFHSFRHTFKDRARDAGISEGLQRQLMGHAGKDTADDYGSGFGLHRLVEAMNRYRVPGFKPPLAPPVFRGRLEAV